MDHMEKKSDELKDFYETNDPKNNENEVSLEMPAFDFQDNA